MGRLLFLLTCLSACAPQAASDLSEKSRQEIIVSDKAMSDLAIASGFSAALLEFADDSLVKPEEGKFPVIGKKALENFWAGSPGTKGISWEPFKAEAAQSGELGYSVGNWKFETPDTIYYGNYFTAWKKGADGKWRWVVDGGNNTPAPQ